jgi:hypothetical protein
VIRRVTGGRTLAAVGGSLAAAGLLGAWLLTTTPGRPAGRPAPVAFGLAVPPDCTLVTPDTPWIDRPGHYCLGASLVRPRGLEIISDRVTLDLGGHCLQGSGDPAGETAGIRIPYAQSDVVIRNGCVTGFMYGVLGNDVTDGEPSSDITVTAMELQRNWFRGVSIAGDRVIVSHNLVADIGGTTAFPDAFAIGIEVRGNHCEIVRNQVSDVYPTGSGEGVGISVTNDDTTDCVVARNVVRNERLPPWGRTFGLWIPGRSTIRDNVTIRHTFGIAARRPRDLSGNLIVAEACAGYFGSVETAGSDTLFLPGEDECSEDLEVALRNVVRGHPESLMRVAGIHHTNGEFVQALVYYQGAAALGNQEAQRQIARLLEVGLVTAADVAAAADQADALGLR